MRYVSGTIDLAGWEFLAGELNPILSDTFGTTLTNVLKDDPPDAYLEWPWADSPDADPLALRFKLSALGPGEGLGPEYEISLATLADEALDMITDENHDDDEAAEARAKLMRFTAALRSLADSVDAKIMKS